MKKILIPFLQVSLLNLVFITSLQAQSSQLPQAPITIQSPNAAGLGMYGEMPVSYFTGVPNIEIPLYTLKEREIEVPISLSYHASGFRPDQHPGWVGQGWSLNVGGIISRAVNDFPDEQDIHADASNPTGGNPQSGYYYTHSVNSNLNWSSTVNIANQAQNNALKDSEPDEFSFQFADYSGKFYLDASGNWKVRCNKPVKLIFNGTFLDVPFTVPQPRTGLPGFVYMKSFSGFTIVTEDGTQYIFGGTTDAIDYQIPLYNENQAHWVANSWYLTSIVSKNGNETVRFNYQRDSFIDQIGMSVNINLGTQTVGPGLNCTESSYDPNNVLSGELISPVYLTNISTSNFTVSFLRCGTTELAYTQDKYDYQHQIFPSSELTNGLICYPFFNANFFTTTGCGTGTGNDNSLDAVTLQMHTLQVIGGGGGTDNYPASLQNLQWKQLNNIIVQQSGGIVKQFAFNYSSDVNTRLTLNSLIESGSDGTQKPPYVFSYNSAPPPTTAAPGIPGYVTVQTDHWGFWNGTNAFIPSSITQTDVMSNYYNLRQPVLNYPLTNMLNEIKYPTGGVTDFVYEPNYYSRQLKTVRSDGCNPPSAAPLLAGGIRIKSIISSDPAIANSKVEKDYYYVTGYDNNYSANPSQYFSSGTLGGQFQYYFTDYRVNSFNSSGTATYSKQVFSSQSQLPGCYNAIGTHIGYSEVAEKRSDGSYTKFLYTNFDNVNDSGHLDEPTQVLQVSRIAYEPFTSLDEERGKLLTEEVHNTAGKLLKSTSYTYTALDKANAFVPAIKASAWYLICGVTGSGQQIAFQDGALYKYYTYSYLPSSKTTTVYDGNGLNPVAATENYYYDNPLHKQVTRSTFVNSKGETLTTFNIYPQDYASGSGFIDQMVVINNIGSPIETTILKSSASIPSELVSGKITEYLSTGDYPSKVYSLDLSQPIAQTAFKQSNEPLGTAPFGVGKSAYSIDTNYRAAASFDYNYEKLKNFNLYTSTTVANQSTAYLWDVSRRNPVATVKNANFQQIAFSGFEESETFNAIRINNPNNWNIPAGVVSSTSSLTGHNCGLVTGATISTVDAIPVGTYTVSYWSKAGSLTLSGCTIQRTVTGATTASGWTYYEHTISLSAAANVSVIGNAAAQYIDDLRLYPVGAQMTSYTYDPLVGMTSSSDGKGEITYYEYDSFQRLMNIKDKDHNIIKHIDYHYQGQ